MLCVALSQHRAAAAAAACALTRSLRAAQIAGINRIGVGPFSKPSIGVRTSTTEPDQPLPPDVVVREPTRLKLRWLAPDDNGARIGAFWRALPACECRALTLPPCNARPRPTRAEKYAIMWRREGLGGFEPLMTVMTSEVRVGKADTPQAQPLQDGGKAKTDELMVWITSLVPNSMYEFCILAHNKQVRPLLPMPAAAAWPASHQHTTCSHAQGPSQSSDPSEPLFTTKSSAPRAPMVALRHATPTELQMKLQPALVDVGADPTGFSVQWREGPDEANLGPFGPVTNLPVPARVVEGLRTRFADRLSGIRAAVARSRHRTAMGALARASGAQGASGAGSVSGAGGGAGGAAGAGKYGDDAATQEWDPELTVNFTLRPLMPERTYVVRVAAMNRHGLGEFTQSAPLHTPNRVAYILQQHGGARE